MSPSSLVGLRGKLEYNVPGRLGVAQILLGYRSDHDRGALLTVTPFAAFGNQVLWVTEIPDAHAYVMHHLLGYPQPWTNA